MKKVGNHNSISRKLFLGLALSLIFSLTSFAQEAAPAVTDAAAAPAAATSGDAVKGKDDDQFESHGNKKQKVSQYRLD